MNIDYNKYPDGLVPAIIQDANSKNVLMLGYMNANAVSKTVETNKVTFFSRSKQRLWTKGEESGNFLELVKIQVDCDSDALLIKANPVGPTCHKGTDTCWGDTNTQEYGFLTELEGVITNRKEQSKKITPENKSYVADLFAKGINKVAQKVGEEAVEVVIEAKDDNDELFLDESADLLFHYLILLQAKGFVLNDVVSVLKGRHS